MFHLEHITKIYRRRQQEVVAFKAESLDIKQGEYVAVVGPSGCGKTTLLSMLGGMLSPDTGKIWFDGESLYDLSRPRSRRASRAPIVPERRNARHQQ